MKQEVNTMKLGLSKTDIALYEEKKIEFNKRTSRIMKKSRAQSKRSDCYICGKECSSFCNSHSVPRFCLENISPNGYLLYSGNLVDMPMLDKDKGINEAGTFHIICNDCDGKVFKDYENPGSYTKEPTDKMLAQIAMKNNLRNISKRELENAIYPNIEQLPDEVVNHIISINELDLREYVDGFNNAKKASESKWNNHFFLGYFEILDYVVPVAFQNSVVLISDLEDVVINDIYNQSRDYTLSELHISIFPLKSHSVVIMFIKNGEKRYRNFFKQFRKLTKEEKLKVINYIIFSYSEDVFVYKGVSKEVLEDKELKKVAQQTTMTVANTPYANSLKKAKEDFNLSNRNKIPNLLDEIHKVR